MAVLKILTGTLSGQQFALLAEGTFIGRHESNAIRIVESSVSGRHAKIWQEKGKWLVQDLKSTNGTLVNNAEAPPNTPQSLDHQDKLSFGHVVAVFDAMATLQPPAPAGPDPEELEAAQAEIMELRKHLVDRDRTIGELNKRMSGEMVPRAQMEAELKGLEVAMREDAAGMRESFKRNVRELEQKIVEMTAEAQALERAVKEKHGADVKISLPSKDREVAEKASAEIARLQAALDEVTGRERRLREENEARSAELKEISGVRRAVQAEASAGASRVQELEEELERTEEMLGEARAEADRNAAARVEAANLHQEVGQLKQKITQQEHDYNELRRERERDLQTLGANEADLATLRAQAVQLREKLLMVEDRAQQAEAKAAKAEAGGAEADRLRARVKDLEEALATTEQDLDKAKQGQTAAAEEELQGLRKELKKLRGNVALADEALAAEKAKVAELEHRLEAHVKTMESLEAELEAAEGASMGAAAEADERVTALEQELAAAKEGAAAGGTELESARARMTALEDELAGAMEDALAAHARADGLAGELAQARESAASGAAGAEEAVQAANARSEALEAELAHARELAASGAAGAEEAVKSANARIDALGAELAAAQEKAEALEAELAHARESAASGAAAADEAVKAANARSETLGAELAAAHEQARAARIEADALKIELSGSAAALAGLEAEVGLLREQAAGAGRAASLEAQLAALQEELEGARGELEAVRSAPVPAAGEGADDYGRAEAALLRALADLAVDAVNGEVSRLRRNMEILKGYVDDCARVASFVTGLDPATPGAAELVDEVQPDDVVTQLRGVADECSDAASKAKGLLLDLKEALASAEATADLERSLTTAQGLLSAAGGDEVPVEVGAMLPLLPCEPPRAVLFGFSLVREARAFAEGATALRLDVDGDTITLRLAPLGPGARARWEDTLAGGGDERSRFIEGFVRRTCGGTLAFEDAALVATLRGSA